MAPCGLLGTGGAEELIHKGALFKKKNVVSDGEVPAELLPYETWIPL